MPGLGVVFWNLNRRPLAPRAARLVRAHAPDVVILAECDEDPGAVAAELTGAGVGAWTAAPAEGRWLQTYSRPPVVSWTLIYAGPGQRWLIYRITARGLPPLLFVVAHLPSKLWAAEPDQRLAAKVLAEDIRGIERKYRHQRTVVVGDLNMNPFEEGVAGAGHLHAVMTRAMAAGESRVVQGEPYPLFYNPTWGGFGDRTIGPPGTYYRPPSGALYYGWNTFDQVLLRPAIMTHLADLRVLDSDGVETLLSPTGHPDRGAGSDHLPIWFQLKWGAENE